MIKDTTVLNEQKKKVLKGDVYMEQVKKHHEMSHMLLCDAIENEANKMQEQIEYLNEVLRVFDTVTNPEVIFEHYHVNDKYELEMLYENMLFFLDGMNLSYNALKFNIVNGSTENMSLLSTIAQETMDVWSMQSHPELDSVSKGYVMYGMQKVCDLCDEALNKRFDA